MNLWVKKSRLVTFVALLALTTISCEDPGSIGLDVDSQSSNVNTFVQELVLPSSVVQFNPRKTFEANSIQAGRYSSPEFGKLTSKSYAQLSLANSLPSVPSDAEFIDFKLSIKFDDFIGESALSNEIQEIEIFQLAEDIDPLGDYDRLSEVGLMASPMGILNFMPVVNDTSLVDSTFVVPLDALVGNDLFDKLKNGDPIFDSNDAFNEFFHGVAFVPGNKVKEIYQFSIGSIRFTINYNIFNVDGTPVERSYILQIGKYNFYHIDTDLAGTALEGIQPDNSDFEPTDNNRYLQFGTLMAIKINLQPFFDLTDTIEHMIINKAEVIIGPVNSFSDGMAPPNIINVYFTELNNKWPIVVDTSARYAPSEVGRFHVMLQRDDGSISPGFYSFPQTVIFNDNSLTYNASLSFFLQSLYSSKFISPSEPFIEEQGLIYLYGGTNTVLPQIRNSHRKTSNFSLSKDNIKLKIHYSFPSQVDSSN